MMHIKGRRLGSSSVPHLKGSCMKIEAHFLWSTQFGIKHTKTDWSKQKTITNNNYCAGTRPITLKLKNQILLYSRNTLSGVTSEWCPTAHLRGFVPRATLQSYSGGESIVDMVW